MSKQEFLVLLAEMICREANDNPCDSSEPYRAAGDRLVDEALSLIDEALSMID